MIEQITTDPTKVRAGQDFQIKVKVTQYNTTTDEGEDLSIPNTKQNGKMKFDLYGNTTQTVIEADDGSTVEGTGIVTANDVENEKVHYLTPDGNTIQDGTPTPESPVAINNLTGTLDVKTENKNFLKPNDSLSSNVVSINSNGEIVINGTVSTAIFISKIGSIDLKNGTYKGHIEITGEINGSYLYFINEQNQQLTFTKSNTQLNVSVTNELSQNIRLVVVAGTYNNVVIKMQFEEGTTATDYVVHQEQVVNFPLSEGQYLAEGGYLADDGIHNIYGQIVLNGTENWSMGLTSRFILDVGKLASSNTGYCDSFTTQALGYTDGITFLKNTSNIYIQYNEKTNVTDFKAWLSTHNVLVQYVLETESITAYTQEQQTAWEQIKAMTLYDGVTHVSFSGNIDGKLKLQYNVVLPSPSPEVPSTVNVVTGTKTITISNEDDSQSQVKTVRLGSLELCKIGDYQDCIFKNTPNSIYYDNTLIEGAWYKRGVIGKVVLNGSENWINKNITDNNLLFSTEKIDTLVNRTINNGFSNYFKIRIGLWDNDIEGYAIVNLSASLRVRIKNSLLSDISTKANAVNSFKAWLSTYNTEVYYVLATPVITQITDTNLIDDLEDLRTSLTYANETNITQPENELPFWLEVKAEVEA